MNITAHVITCPGRLGDDAFHALEINVEGVQSPFHMVMALPAVTCKHVGEQIDLANLYQALADGINFAQVKV